MINGVFYIMLLTGLCPIEGVSAYFFLYPHVSNKMHVFNVSSVSPDKTLRPVVSDLGSHCLPLSLLLDARYK